MEAAGGVSEALESGGNLPVTAFGGRKLICLPAELWPPDYTKGSKRNDKRDVYKVLFIPHKDPELYRDGPGYVYDAAVCQQVYRPA